jgi:hypothetical protein
MEGFAVRSCLTGGKGMQILGRQPGGTITEEEYVDQVRKIMKQRLPLEPGLKRAEP